MKRKNMTGKGLAAGLLCVFLFLFAGTTALHSGSCEQAFLRCLHDPYWQAVPFGIVYCSTGYAFCLKYIEG